MCQVTESYSTVNVTYISLNILELNWNVILVISEYHSSYKLIICEATFCLP